MRNVSFKSCRGNQNTYFVFKSLFLRKSCPLRNNVEPYCIVGQATDDNMAHIWGYKCTHSGCVILIALPLQQRLHEHASMLRYTYIASLVLSFFTSLTSVYPLIVGVEGYCCTWSHSMTHTHTLGWTPLDEGQNGHTRQGSTTIAEFEPANSASARSQTYALDCAATGVGDVKHKHCMDSSMKKEVVKSATVWPRWEVRIWKRRYFSRNSGVFSLDFQQTVHQRDWIRINDWSLRKEDSFDTALSYKVHASLSV